MTRHDQLAKELLRSFFEGFLRLTAPGPAGRLLIQAAQFLDQQTFTDWPEGRRREVDLLAEIPLPAGDRPLLVHIEVEARARTRMARRLWHYFMQIRLRHDRPVLPILLNLRGGPPGLTVQTLEDGFDGDEPPAARFCYRVLGLSGCRAEEYLESPEPVAWALAALMRPERWSRAELKLECLQRIAAARLPAGQEFLLVNWVETYLQLRGADLAEYEKLRQRAIPEEMHVMQLTWAERMEREYTKKGRQEGRQEERRETVHNLRKLVLRQLEQRFGPIPETTRQKIEEIDSPKRLTSIAEKVLVVPSLGKLRLG